ATLAIATTPGGWGRWGLSSKIPAPKQLPFEPRWLTARQTGWPTPRRAMQKPTTEILMTRRVAILTSEVLASIPALVEQGLHRAEIAERLGCKLATLQVRCSNAGISLRGRKRLELRNGTPLTLSREALASLKARAAADGCSEAQLVTNLIETIAR